MDNLTLLSPAKLNLFFSLIKKREDGFYEIASLYQAIDLFDTLHISLSPEDHFTTNNVSLPTDDTNLVIKALNKFREHTGFSHPVTIHLEKSIPIESGLGGGSSNAATTLWGLNKLANTPLSIEQLIEIAASFGSDISFFFSNGTAYCTGRGEIIENISLSAPFVGFLITNSFGLSTPKVYRNVTLEDLGNHDPKKLLETFLDNNQKPLYLNDLERSAFFLEPRLATVKQSLLDLGFFDQVTMTGSGTAFFAIPSEMGQNLQFPYKKIQNVQRNANSWYGN